MRKDDLLKMLMAENTKESKELATKLTFLKEMFFKNELNETEQDKYLAIHGKDTLKAFMFSHNLQEKYEEYCKKEQSSNPFNEIPVFDFDKTDPLFENVFKRIFETDKADVFHRMPRRGSDIEKVIVVTPEEAREGSTRYIRMNGKRIEVKIPTEASDGTRITINGIGEESPNGGKPGNLYVYVHIETGEPIQESTKVSGFFDDTNKRRGASNVQGEKCEVDSRKKYLCKYHHNVGCTSDKPGDGFSEKRCPGCGQFYVPLQDSSDWSNYTGRSDPAARDDENDMERIQDAYDPPEAIYGDDGSIEYW